MKVAAHENRRRKSSSSSSVASSSSTGMASSSGSGRASSRCRAWRAPGERQGSGRSSYAEEEKSPGFQQVKGSPSASLRPQMQQLDWTNQQQVAQLESSTWPEVAANHPKASLGSVER